MTVFLSHARADQIKAEAIAQAIKSSGQALGSATERELDAAHRVLVAWSGSARENLWVRAQANEALDQGKLVQVSLDGAEPPLPFAMLPWTSLQGWSGRPGDAPWPHIERQLGGGADAAAAVGRRPDPGGIAVLADGGPALQGFGRMAALGWAALATTALLALCAVMVTRRLISAGAFAAISFTSLAVAAALLVASAFLLLRSIGAGRR